MPFSYPQVTIGGQAYDAYVTVAGADTYLNGSVNAAAWNALSEDDKGRAIVSAVRVIDAQNWKGEKADPENALAWPRTCQDDPIQLAFAISQNPELIAPGQAGQSGTKRLKAGSVEIEYFNTGVTPGQANSSAIWSILAPLADCLDSASAGAGLLTGAFSSGTRAHHPERRG